MSDMSDLRDHQQVIDAFERLVSTPRSMKSEIQARQVDGLPPAPNNHIRIKGLEHKTKRAGRTGKIEKSLTADQSAKGDSHLEHHIHTMIVKHPFLLHTPELYSGGLYLDSVLNKRELPCHLIPDFAYITVQDRVIKITLVEIEQATKGVFNHQAKLQATFRGETRAAIKQVRSWQALMENDDNRRTFLNNLKPLFKNYPVEIFNPGGGVSSATQISLGYVLIVGSETIKTPVQQQMVDDLYLNENILFMTYPMLIKQLRQGISAKNMIKVDNKGVRVETLEAPEQLLSKGPDLGIPMRADNDPFGIKMAGLGWNYRSSGRCTNSSHPASIKQIFYRAQGKCEYAGCSAPIIQNGQVHGGLKQIYDFFHRDDCNAGAFSDTDYVGLFCNEHIQSFNNGCKYILGQSHPMNEAMRQRRAYRPSHDADALTYSSNWKYYLSNRLLKVLEIDAVAEPGLANDVVRWSMAVVSLPEACQNLLHQIILASFDNPRTPIHFNWSSVQYLARARVVSVRDSDQTTKAVAPAVFNQTFIQRIRSMFRERTPQAVKALCEANADELENQLKYLDV